MLTKVGERCQSSQNLCQNNIGSHLPRLTAECGTFTEISGAPKGHKSGAGAQKSLNFSQVCLSSVQMFFVYQVLYFYFKQR